MILKAKRLQQNATIPARALPGDLGFDLFAVDNVCVQAGETVAAKTGIALEFPEAWGGIIKARSSQGKIGIDVFGGVVDSGYRRRGEDAGLVDGEKLEPNSLLDGDDKLDIPTFLRKHLD